MSLPKYLVVFVFFSITALATGQDTVNIQIPVQNDNLTQFQIDSIIQAQLDSINQVRIDSIEQARLAQERGMMRELNEILTRTPAATIESLHDDMEAIISLDTIGINRLVFLLNSPDPEQVSIAEYALSGVAKFLSDMPYNDLRRYTEIVFCDALTDATSIEQQVFLIDQLQYFGSDYSVSVLSDYLVSLCDPVTRTLFTIATPAVITGIVPYLEEIPLDCKRSIIKSLYRIRSSEALQLLIKYANDPNDPETRYMAMQALANTADPAAYEILSKAANQVGYDKDQSGSTTLLLRYAGNLITAGNDNLASTILSNVWEKSPSYELKAESFSFIYGQKAGVSQSFLKKIFKSGDPYLTSAAIQIITDSEEINPAPFLKWLNRSDPDIQAQLIHMAAAREYSKSIPKIRGFLDNSNPDLRLAAIQATSSLSGRGVVPELLEILQSHPDERSRKVVEKELNHWLDTTNLSSIDQAFNTFDGPAKASIINIIAHRNIDKHLNELISLCSSPDQTVATSALQATEKMASLEDLDQILQVSTQHMNANQEQIFQLIITKIISQEKDTDKQSPLVFKALRNARDKSIVIKTLSSFQTELTFTEVAPQVFSSDEEMRNAARHALFNWRGEEAIPVLFDLLERSPQSDKNDILSNTIRAVSGLDVPEEQKLLLLRKCAEYSREPQHLISIIQACADLSTFTAFMFTSRFLDDDHLKEPAAKALITIALPDEAGRGGLSGDTVVTLLRKAVLNLDDTESYTNIEVQSYIDNMPDMNGFVSLFNGKDLSGWQGLVENPIARSNMKPEEMMQKQKEADAKLGENWVVRDGKIVFIGEGYDNLCSVKSFKDFELLVDWKISKNSDSGIYLRGSPQVQIWDTSTTELGAFVGSGGLFNNQEYERIPLVVADNPVGDWNTFLIRMIDEKVTVYLNGQKAVDYTIMENYWDRSLPIFETGPVELQAHTTNVEFRDIYIREIDNAHYPTEGEQEQGFVSLFNGINLDGWVGNKEDYTVEDGTIVIKPGAGSGTGNLFTKDEYDNFKLRFEFKLTPGANNGLGFHAPLEGDAAYQGKELQILDNTHEKWENLENYQYHGSLYGVMPAVKGHLLSAGSWNRQEVTVQGSKVDVILNGRLILSGDWKEASQEGTLDGREHPGLDRYSGHIGFLGHGDEVAFRNIRILKLNSPVMSEEGN